MGPPVSYALPKYLIVDSKKGTTLCPFLSCLCSFSLLQLLFDLGGLAYTVTEIVQLGTAYTATAYHFHSLNIGGMQGEHTLHAYAIRYHCLYGR